MAMMGRDIKNKPVGINWKFYQQAIKDQGFCDSACFILFVTDVTQASNRMRAVASHENHKLLIHNNQCVTSVRNKH